MIGQCLSNKNKSATVSKSKKNLDLNKAWEWPQVFEETWDWRQGAHFSTPPDCMEIYTNSSFGYCYSLDFGQQQG